MATLKETQARIPRDPFFVANWLVDPASGQLQRNGEVVKLEPRTMAVLAYLAERPGAVVSREELEAAVWAPAIVGYDAVATTILKLRKSFGDDARSPQVIQTLPKRGYRLVAPVRTDDKSVGNTGEADRSPMLNRWSRRRALVSVLALVVAGAALSFSLWHSGHRVKGIPRVTLAVLPFQDLDGKADQQYFTDGITDDLITDLTKVSGLFVISRDSSFSFRDGLNIAQIAERLGVRYLIHGSVRRAGNQVRINAELIDAHNGSQVWAERYDGNVQNIFEFQDRITQQIASALVVTLTDAERQRAVRKDTDNVAAYEQFLLGEQQFFRYAKQSNGEARASFSKAVQLDPHFARAYAMLGWTHVFDYMNGWSDAPSESLVKSEQFASQALALNEALPVAYFVRGLTYREQGEYVKALVEAEKAIALDPNYANGYVLHATLLYYAGRPKEGLEEMEKAVRLNPLYPSNYPFHMGQAYFVLKRYPEAIKAFKEGIDTNPMAERLHVWLAAAYAQSGDISSAEWEINQVRVSNPDFSLARIRKVFPFNNPADLEHFLDGLRKAGLSDSVPKNAGKEIEPYSN